MPNEGCIILIFATGLWRFEILLEIDLEVNGSSGEIQLDSPPCMLRRGYRQRKDSLIRSL
jgi:hypothetical protein